VSVEELADVLAVSEAIKKENKYYS